MRRALFSPSALKRARARSLSLVARSGGGGGVRFLRASARSRVRERPLLFARHCRARDDARGSIRAASCVAESSRAANTPHAVIAAAVVAVAAAAGPHRERRTVAGRCAVVVARMRSRVAASQLAPRRNTRFA